MHLAGLSDLEMACKLLAKQHKPNESVHVQWLDMHVQV